MKILYLVNRSKDQSKQMAATVFTPSLEGMKNVKSENGVMLTKPFLDVCKFLLPVLGTIVVFALVSPSTDHCSEAFEFDLVLVLKREIIFLLIIRLN